jgi:hypothetical protein
MPRVSRKNRIKNRSSDYQNITSQSVERAAVNRPKIMTQTYDASRYIKKDLMWSALAAGLVIMVGIVLYIFFR